MPTYISIFFSISSFLLLIFLVAYLTWKNDWLFNRLSDSQRETAEAQVEAAKKGAEIEKIQQIRLIEIALYEEKSKQLAAEVARIESARVEALSLSASKDNNSSQSILTAAGKFFGGFFDW
jgi:hypothetical protein